MRALPTSTLFVSALLPTTIYVCLQTSSMAAGTAVAAAIALMLNPGVSADGRALRGAAVVATLVCAFLLGHLFVAAFWGEVNLVRAGASMTLLVLMAVGSRAGSIAIFRSPAVGGSARRLFWVLVAIAAASAIDLQPPVDGLPEKAVFPFNEPSHFALAFTPFLLFTAVMVTGARRLALLAVALGFGYVLENLTLVVGAVLSAMVTLRPRHALLLAPLVALVPLRLDLTYFLDRLSFSEDSSNVSVLVYLQGWEMMRATLFSGALWGIGFQQLGESDLNLWTSHLIVSIVGDDLNVRDGGFLVAKIVTELGVFGVVASAFLLCVSIKAAWKLRRIATTRRERPTDQILALCLVAAFLVDLVVRSNGYFSGTSFLYISALWHLRAVRRVSRSELPDAAAGNAIPD